ncbi:MAG: protein-L-isoaspartate(D-aspartate) O-methyltransferase, partial [Myxococcales bacterium]|nr:protein-L-isoaspartate(D-aspartate) O-methyltransferase [Myxococcales bacterium]
MQMVVRQLGERDIFDPRVLEAFRRVPRHELVPRTLWDEAYEDHPLPIGEGQTISQPYMVAIMLQLLRLRGVERVLEIGTGSGYQTALLAELAAEVFSIERVPTLAERAEGDLERLGYRNVSIRVGDGTLGWPECAPYDAIVVSAGAPRVPAPLVEQLGDGGVLAVPVGSRSVQYLTLVRRRG